MYVFSQKVVSAVAPTLTLALTAEERTRSRYRYRLIETITDDDGSTVADSGGGQEIYLELPRGTLLQDGDCLGGDTHGQVLKIVAKPEPVLTVRASSHLWLLRAAYHLGNRHVALEIGPDYVRLTPDSVLEDMLSHFRVTVIAETLPFQPEAGAYGHHH